MNRARGLAILAAAAFLAVASPRTEAAIVFDCLFNGGGGDNLDRGFYVDGYTGVTLDTVTLRHRASTTGVRTIQLTARLTSYSGTILGTASVTQSINSTGVKSVFDFGNVPVAAGSRITFAQVVTSGNTSVTFDVGIGPCFNVTETEGTSPPLDAFHRNSIGLVITGAPQSIANAWIVECPYQLSAVGGGDEIDHGFYVTNYGGVTLDHVRMRHSSDTPGVKTIALVARLGSFDGPLIGSANVSRSIDGTKSESIFDFNDRPVPAGSTITFTQVLTAGTTRVFFDTGFGPCPDVVETGFTNPPLDSPHFNLVGVKVDGRVASDNSVQVVEYYHSVFGHYFMTADPAEIAGLDGGAYGGVFSRTGAVLYARDGPVNTHVDVCRFFTVTFAPKSSHFYTADPVECAGVKLNPDWQYEKVAFYVKVPVAGACGVGLTPIYRLYNQGMTGAPNHRFTTSLAVYNDFVNNRGWAGEGIKFCQVPLV